MKSVSHISIIILIGIVAAIPIREHYCDIVIAQETVIHEDEFSCCEHKSMLKDCCYTENQFYTVDHLLNITFSNFEIGHLSGYRIENLASAFYLRYDLYNQTHSFKSTSVIPPKNELGLYIYVQSFLL